MVFSALCLGGSAVTVLLCARVLSGSNDAVWSSLPHRLHRPVVQTQRGVSGLSDSVLGRVKCTPSELDVTRDVSGPPENEVVFRALQ